MPEGDTIFRAAASLRQWIGGREVTAATGRDTNLDAIVGSTVTAVDTQGKHLLIRFSSGHILHTHMRMSGSWHVYPQGVTWRRSPSRARAVIECGDRIAVCFNAPVVELVRDHDERAHPALRRLGPDILAPGFDVGEVVRRVRVMPPDEPISEVLLDQTVVAGIGNVYRCEALFDQRLDPWTPIGELSDDALLRLVNRAKTMLEQGVEARFQRRVHGRHRHPCPRCATPIKAQRYGRQARVVFFCPKCQQRPGDFEK